MLDEFLRLAVGTLDSYLANCSTLNSESANVEVQFIMAVCGILTSEFSVGNNKY